MFGVDSNVLLRAFLDDDPLQSAATKALVGQANERQPLFIGLPVLMELSWVLRRREPRPYKNMLAAIALLLTLEHVVIQDRAEVEEALGRARRGLGDFADSLVALVARTAGATTTYTFDRRAAQSDGFTLLTA